MFVGGLVLGEGGRVKGRGRYTNERERQGPDRRYPILKSAKLFILFSVQWPKKKSLCDSVFLKRGPVSRQDSENDKI